MLSLSDPNESIGTQIILASTMGGPVSDEAWLPGTVVMVAESTVFVAVVDAETRVRLAIRYKSSIALGDMHPGSRAAAFGVTGPEQTWQAIDDQLNEIARSDDWRKAVREVVASGPILNWIRREIEDEAVI